MSLLGILLGILVLSLMMFIHELGHFLAGKALGFGIESFNIFMGPIIWSRRGKDGVLYALRLFPIGASVQFFGDEADDAELAAEEAEEASCPPEAMFFNKSRWQRAIVIAMGPLVNFLTAFLAFILLFNISPPPIPVIAEIAVGSSAEQAGLSVGDKILSIDGQRILTGLDVSMLEIISSHPKGNYLIRKEDGRRMEIAIEPVWLERYRLGINYDQRSDGRILISYVDARSNEGKPLLQIGDELLRINGNSVLEEGIFEKVMNASDGKPIRLELVRDGVRMEIEMKAVKFRDRLPEGFYFDTAHSLAEKLEQAALYPLSIVRSTLKGLGMIFSGRMSARDGLTGPIGIVKMVGGVVTERVSSLEKLKQLLLYFAFISVAVGFTNLLPIPPLDGNHLLILAVERIRGKDLSLRVKTVISKVGLAIILLLTALVLYLDISRLLN